MTVKIRERIPASKQTEQIFSPQTSFLVLTKTLNIIYKHKETLKDGENTEQTKKAFHLFGQILGEDDLSKTKNFKSK